jgi:succinyl-CoA:cyclohexane-1-carboxylate CoA transferase
MSSHAVNTALSLAASYAAEYRQKLCPPETAAAAVQNGEVLVFPICAGEPLLFTRALAARQQSLEGVTINQQHHVCKDYFTEEAARHIKVNSWFTSGASRQAVQKGWADWVPNYFHEVPRLMTEYWPVDWVGTMVSPMDEHGYFTCSLSVAYTMAALKKANKVVVQVNENCPRTHGNCHIHISEVDFILESSDPLVELPIPPVTAIEEAIGGYIAELIEDGSTLQLGIGGIPNAVCRALLNKHDLGIHTEMITDGMVDLLQSGAANNSRKTLNPGKTIGTFALGTRRLYQFMHDNPTIEMHPVDYTNDPYIIGQHEKMVSINATIEVDLLGQCASESLGTLHWSGTGGQADFVRGATRSKGGKSFITLPATAKGGSLSRIVPTLQAGAVVTTNKNEVDYVVSEYGVAHLRGRSARQRAAALIAIAHPDFRAELTAAARGMNRL